MPKFDDWRSDKRPKVEREYVALPDSPEAVAACARSMALLEHSITDVCLEYVERPLTDSPFEGSVREEDMRLPENPGPLLEFASALSQRYLDLFEAIRRSKPSSLEQITLRLLWVR